MNKINYFSMKTKPHQIIKPKYLHIFTLNINCFAKNIINFLKKVTLTALVINVLNFWSTCFIFSFL